jgi:hypothetical protein
VTTRDRPSRHQEPGGRIMRAKNALISGEASWPLSASSRCRIALSRLLAAVTIAGPVIAAAWAFRFRGGRFGWHR